MAIAIAVLLAVVSVSIARSVARTRTAAARTSSPGPTSAPIFGLIAAAALLIDYVMTVAVSTAAAIAQIQSVLPAAYDIRIEIAFISITLITVANLRGLRESGNIFAVPTYLFVGLALAMVAIGVVRIVTATAGAGHRPSRTQSSSAPRRSASCCCSRRSPAGSVALTGVEAIANGVPAFKPPESKNAADTMTLDGRAAGDPVHRHDVRSP